MWCTVNQLNPNIYSFVSKQAAVFNIHPEINEDYCDFELPLEIHYRFYYNVYGNSTPAPYSNVPKTFTRLKSSSNNPQYQSSWRTIPSGATSEYVAHEEVVLRDGFYAETGSNFYAHIVPCESCNEDRMTNDMADVVGVVDENSFDSIPVPKLLQGDVFSSEDAMLSVYPNPTNDLLFIELSGGAGIANVAMYDLQGRFVGANNHSLLQETTATLDVKSVPSGVYILRVTDTDGKEYHQKIVRK